MSSERSLRPTTTSIEGLIRWTDRGLTFRDHFALVGGGYIGLAMIELLTHWLLTESLCRPLLRIYLLHTPTGGVSIFPDLLFPALLLGWWNAWVTRKSTLRRALGFVLPLALAIVALLPPYAMLVGRVAEVWWWPKGISAIAVFLGVQLFFATIAVLLPVKAYHKSFPI